MIDVATATPPAVPKPIVPKLKAAKSAGSSAASSAKRTPEKKTAKAVVGRSGEKKAPRAVKQAPPPSVDNADEEEAHYDRVKSFLRATQLDLDNAVDLMRATIEQQQHVLDNFQKKEGTRNVNVAFHTWLWEYLDSQAEMKAEEPAEAEDPAEEPAEESPKDEDDHVEPAEEPAEEPPEEPVDSPMDDAAPADVASDGASDAGVLDAFERFQERWGVDDPSMKRLRDLPIELQEEIMETFDPHPDLPNKSRALLTHIKLKSNNLSAEDRPPWLKPRENDDQPPQESDDQPLRGIDDFAEAWSLTEESIEALREVSPQLQDEVMNAFQPRQDTRDKNIVFMAFLTSRKNYKGGKGGKGGKGFKSKHPGNEDDAAGDGPPAEMDPELQDFREKWGVDDAAMEMLWRCPIELQDDIMAKFNPKQDEHKGNISARLMSFITRRQFAFTTVQKAPIEDFADKWSLDEDAFKALQRLSPEVQFDVMSNFAPPEGSANYSSRFMAFLKSRSSGPRHTGQGPPASAFKQFAKKWGLEADKLDRLYALSPEMQEDVMEHFNPPPDTRDYNAKFVAFLKSREHPSTYRQKADPAADFGQKWGLNDAAMDRLYELPQNLMEDVMASFNPKGCVGDVSGKFIAFVKSRKAPYDSTSAVDDFARQWELDSVAFDKLRSLPKDVQQNVITSFAPKPGKNTSLAFMQYLKYSGAYEVGDAIQQFGKKWGLHEDTLWQLRNSSQQVQDFVMGTFNPPDSHNVDAKFLTMLNLAGKPTCKYWMQGECKHGGACKFRHARDISEQSPAKHKDPPWASNPVGAPPRPTKVAKDPVAVFQRTWGLDDAAVERFRKLDWHVQEDVMAKFNPPGGPGSEGVNPKFIGYLKSRERNVHHQDEPAWKRQRY